MLITAMLDNADKIALTFAFEGYKQMADKYAPAVYGMVSLAICIFGYCMATGKITLSLDEACKRILMIGFIVVFALNWSIFVTYVYNLAFDAPNEIGQTILKAVPNSPAYGGGGINGALEQVWDDGIALTNAICSKGGIGHWIPFLWAGLILLITILCIRNALFELITAKFTLAIFMILAPLVIPLVLFSSTARIFESWLNQICSAALVPVFVITTLALGLFLMSGSLTDIQSALDDPSKLTLITIAPYIVYGLIVSGLVNRASSMAHALGSGCCLSVMPHVHSMSQRGFQNAKRTIGSAYHFLRHAVPRATHSSFHSRRSIPRSTNSQRSQSKGNSNET